MASKIEYFCHDLGGWVEKDHLYGFSEANPLKNIRIEIWTDGEPTGHLLRDGEIIAQETDKKHKSRFEGWEDFARCGHPSIDWGRYYNEGGSPAEGHWYTDENGESQWIDY